MVLVRANNSIDQVEGRGIAVHTINPGPIETDMTAGHPMDTADVDETADAIVTELKAGVLDIFPDAAAKQLFALRREDYRKLEAVAAESYEASK